MAKYVYGTFLCLLIVATAVLLVRSEGERTRETIREVARTEIRGGMVEAAEKAVDKAAELPGKIIRDLKGELLGTPEPEEPTKAPSNESDTPPAQKELPEQGGSEEETPEVAPSSRKPQETAPEVSVPEDGSEARSPEPLEGPKKEERKSRGLIGDLFDVAHEATKTIDDVGQEVFELSLEEEIELGREVHKLVLRDHNALKDRALRRRIQRLAKPLLALRSRKEMRYTFTILDSPEVNAFAHAGGYVYLYQGLIDLAATDEELQFVVAHEIAHVDLKHGVRALTYAARAGQLTGGAGIELVQLAYHLIALGYSEDQEFAADEWAFRHQLQLGVRQEQALGFLHRFLEHEREQGADDSPQKRDSVPQAVKQELENHFRSHPATEARIQRLEGLTLERQ